LPNGASLRTHPCLQAICDSNSYNRRKNALISLKVMYLKSILMYLQC
jgi:hypothetical protein